MSLEKEISKVVKQTLENCMIQRPILVKKTTLAAMLDISVDQVDKLIRERTLVEEVHFTRLTTNGNPMFYMPEVIETLRPKQAKEKIII